MDEDPNYVWDHYYESVKVRAGVKLEYDEDEDEL